MGNLRLGPPCLSLAISIVLLAGCDSAVKKNPTPADFVGTWTGKWDDQWAAQFSITQAPKAGELQAVYEWEG